MARLREFAKAHKAHLLLGTFQEELVIGDYKATSNTALHLTPEGKVQLIRKVRGSDSFTLYDREGGKSHREFFVRDNAPEAVTVAKPYLDESLHSRRFTLANGKSVLPLICAEVYHAQKLFPDAKADIIVNMAREATCMC